MSPVVRHGIVVSFEFFHRRRSWFSSNVTSTVPLLASRVKARYKNASPPSG